MPALKIKRPPRGAPRRAAAGRLIFGRGLAKLRELVTPKSHSTVRAYVHSMPEYGVECKAKNTIFYRGAMLLILLSLLRCVVPF